MLCAPHGGVLGSTWRCIWLHMEMDGVIHIFDDIAHFSLNGWMGWKGPCDFDPNTTVVNTLKLHVGISKSFGKFDTVSCVSTLILSS